MKCERYWLIIKPPLPAPSKVHSWIAVSPSMWRALWTKRRQLLIAHAMIFFFSSWLYRMETAWTG